ncbi:hypothetical protein LP419_22810 [Massilia sp. H-1]|nr:hypothetical protein LP419_22810 [Massilia sp. H-1]
MTDFLHHVETRLGELKAQFAAIRQWEAFAHASAPPTRRACSCCARATGAAYTPCARACARFSQFDAARLASLMAVPTLPLDEGELRIHRIWLGGPLPALAAEAARQWQCALDAAASTCSATLWVWDARQLRTDPGFIASPGPGWRIGSCVAGRRAAGGAQPAPAGLGPHARARAAARSAARAGTLRQSGRLLPPAGLARSGRHLS